MPATDKVHEPIRTAIEKDGWTITDEPYTISIVEKNKKKDILFADLRAEKIVADQPVRVIVVEIKSFDGESLMYALEQALGQFRIYRKVVAKLEPSSKVYLALTDISYQLLLSRPTFNLLMDDREFSLIIVDIAQEKITEWIE